MLMPFPPGSNVFGFPGAGGASSLGAFNNPQQEGERDGCAPTFPPASGNPAAPGQIAGGGPISQMGFFEQPRKAPVAPARGRGAW